MINKATKTCPICGLEQERGTLDCTRCGWDFSPLLGAPEQVEALLRKRLDQARTAWRQRRYDPDLIPDLEHDPFETPDEFTARLAERPWYVGEGELLKAEYDIETGRFPLGIRSPRPWANPLVDPEGSFSLYLPRDQARELYQRGAKWPVYALLAVNGFQVSLADLVLLAPDCELPVETKVIGNHETMRPIAAAGVPHCPLINGRYRDFGDGTILDTHTGLQWMRCALGQRWNNGQAFVRWDGQTCAGIAGTWVWEALSELVIAFNQKGGYGGHTDWRVPTIKELKTLVEMTSSPPVIDRKAFPEMACGRLWSSAPNADGSGYLWSVAFGGGNVNGTRAVRLVRGGQ